MIVALVVVGIAAIGMLYLLLKYHRLYEAFCRSLQTRDVIQKSAHIGTWEWNIDTGEIKWSDEVFRLLGYEPCEFQINSMTMASMLPEEEREAVVSAMRQLAAKGGGIFQHAVRHKDGSYRIMAGTAETVGKIGSGNCWVVGMVQDVTEPVFADKKLRQSDEKYRSLFSSMMNGFAVHDMVCNDSGVPVDYRFIEINPAFETITGLKKEDIIGRCLSEVLPGAEKEWVNEYGKVALEGKPTRFEKYSEALGKYFEVYAYCPKYGQFATVFIDISARKVIEDRLRFSEARLRSAKEESDRANRAKSEFIASLSHEIRTPIHGIMGLLDLLLESPIQGEQRDNLETAKASSESLLSLVNNILDISKVEAGKAAIEDRPFVLRENLSRIVEMFKLRAEQKGLSLAMRVENEVPDYLSGDVARIRQILINLVGNALKYTDVGGSIAVRVAVESMDRLSATLLFSVADTGIGIPEAKQADLFEPFVQLERRQAGGAGGSGLGLWISKRNAEMMGGRIWFTSREDQGSVFHLAIPLRIVSGTECAIGMTASTSKTASLKPDASKESEEVDLTARILVVEDNPVNQKVVKLLLERRGASVQLAENGRKGVEMYRGFQPDLILMDCRMPEMDGFEATEQIRLSENGSNRRTPIIGLTACALEGDRERCFSSGMDEYLTKPFKKEEFLATVKRFLTSGKQEDNGVQSLILSGKN